ncbi:hypothetical protein [Brachybacterium sp. GPGPB12]|uniref:hypothetical protein n=1 Tax=Brachybacterium sp. GPGPB12 TaxID=3023517 RepID=UPI0031343F9D
MSEIRTASLDMSQLIEERRAANAMRGESLRLIAEDALTPWEAVVAVATSGERPLMRLTLGQLITASDGVGRARARAPSTRCSASSAPRRQGSAAAA